MSTKSVEVPPRDMWLLLLSAVRYAMGRSTYIVDETCEMVLRYRAALTPAQQVQIGEEVSRELRWKADKGDWLGHECDHRRWARLTEALLTEPREEGRG